MKKYILAVLLYSSSIGVSYAQETPDIDFAESSGALTIDLDKMPASPGKVFFGGFFDLIMAGKQKDLVTKYEKTIKPFLSRLSRSMNANNGQLLKIRLYQDEFGNAYLPEYFVLPCGVGMDPVDAYSEYLNTPALSEDISTTARDISYYLWVYKSESGLSIGWIPRELNTRLFRSANLMAMAKVKGDNRVYHPLQAAFPNYLSRANYWKQQVKDYEQQLNAAQRLNESRQLSQRFSDLQLEHAGLVEKYEQMQNRLANNSSFLSTTELILSVISDLNNVYQQTSVSTGSAKENISYDPALIRQRSAILEREIKSSKKQLDEKSNHLEEVDQSLKKLTKGLF